MSSLYLRLLITSLVSSGHCIICPPSIYSFWLPLWYLLAIVLSVLPLFTASDYLFGIFCHCIVCPPSIYSFWLPLWYLLASLYLQLLSTPLVSSGHCIVCPASIYSFWLPLWDLLAIVLSVLPLFTWLPLWYLQTFLGRHTFHMIVDVYNKATLKKI